MNETGIMALAPRNMEEAERLANMLAKSALLPPDLRNKPADVFFQQLTGMALGVDPMTSLREIHIIKGKPVVSAALMVALAKRSPHCEYFQLLDSTDESATYETKRRGDPKPTKLTYTIEQAKKAGLVSDGSNYRKSPADMLRARAASKLARVVYPDILVGVYETSEGEEIRGNANAERVEKVVNEQPAAAPMPSSFDCSPLLAAIEAAATTDALKDLIPQLTTVPADAKATLRAAYNARQAALNAAEQAAEESANG